MCQDVTEFDSLIDEYFNQWVWFLENTGGNCHRCPRTWDADEKREFSARQQTFLALVERLEATPLPHYFCWVAVYYEYDDTSYQLDPNTLICIRADGITRQQAAVILESAAYEFREELLSYDPDNDSYSGRFVTLTLSVLDFTLLHQYASDNFRPKHLTELFSTCPVSSSDCQFDREAWEYWKKRSIDNLNEQSEIHTIRLRTLSPKREFGDVFLSNVKKCTDTTVLPTNNPEIPVPQPTLQESRKTPFEGVTPEEIESELEKLKYEQPPLPETDASNENWIMLDDLVKKPGAPVRKSLTSYRTKGYKTRDKTFGVDSKGQIWVKLLNPCLFFYLRKSLAKKKAKRPC